MIDCVALLTLLEILLTGHVVNMPKCTQIAKGPVVVLFSQASVSQSYLEEQTTKVAHHDCVFIDLRTVL